MSTKQGNLRCLKESLTVTVVDSLRADVPARVISVTRIGASIHTRLFQLTDFLILEPFLDLKQLLRNWLILRVADGSYTAAPCWPLGPEEVSVDFLLHGSHSLLDFVVIRVVVLLPTSEAGLIAGVVCLAVMN